MKIVTDLSKRLNTMSPQHDTPVGQIHPYWARKPMNVISEIITYLSKPNDIILDPFMGSGTTLFAACINNRNAIGTDINPLSIFLVESILNINQNSKQIFNKIEKFILEYSNKVLHWYKVPKQKNRYIERERFIVIGDFTNGNFSLSTSEIVTKTFINNKWRYREVINSPPWQNLSYYPKKYQNFPIDFKKISLIPNSRIAIPEGAKLSHFYTPINIAAINCYIDMVNNCDDDEATKKAYLFLLSSSLPLLRLSDKKASSQWPYWRPKKKLTSRNPVIVLQKKLCEMEKMIQWLNEHFPKVRSDEIKDVFNNNANSPVVGLGAIPIQDLLDYIPKNNCVDLVITDPPYTDYIPYLEYSSSWINILDLNPDSIPYEYEIVKSNSSKRLFDSEEYLKRLSIAFDKCCQIIKPGGYVVWFYLDYNFEHWSKIDKIALKNNVSIFDIIPISKQRRSMKTVTSPGTTLDGDLICVFKKDKNKIKKPDIPYNKIISDIQEQLFIIIQKSFFEKFAFIIKYVLINRCSDKLSDHFIDVRKFLNFIIEDNKTGR